MSSGGDPGPVWFREFGSLDCILLLLSTSQIKGKGLATWTNEDFFFTEN